MDVNGQRGAALELIAVVKRYRDQTAVDGVSFGAEPGEFLTLLGPSGSGKTTTLNIIAGFVAPTTGHVLLDGRRMEGVPPNRRNIGVVFQSYALFPHMTAFDNVAFPLKQRNCTRAERRARVSQALELVRLGDFAASYPRQLSGGQQQRVALARALVFTPGLLLMDEPLGALDRQLREQLQLEIKRIHREAGITFVYVTHDQDEALALSDRIAIFNHGRIEQIGTAAEIYDRPRTLFAAEFIGKSNRLSAVVGPEPGLMHVVAADVVISAPNNLKGATTGSKAHVLIRPERLHVCERGRERTPGVNYLIGVVRQVVYMGSVRRLDVEVSPQSALVLSVQEQSGTGSQAQVGDVVDVAWHPSDAVVLDASRPDLPPDAASPTSAGVSVSTI